MHKSLSHSLLVVSLILVIISSSSSAQQLIPAPRATVELLSNPSFEINTDGDKLPDGWIGKNTTTASADKLKCNKPNKPVAHSGTCAFMFRGNPDGSTSKLQFPISDISALVEGAEVIFSAYIDPRSGVVGSKFGQVTIKYANNTKEKLVLTIPSSGRDIEDYTQVTQSLTLASTPIIGLKLNFRHKLATGKFLIDDASLTVVTDDPTTTPTDTVNETATATSVAATVTNTMLPPTETPTPEPTDTAISPTETPIPTDTPTSTPTATETATATPTNTPLPPPQKLIASDGAALDAFGWSVALDGDTLAVGAPNDDISVLTNNGAAYVFVRSGTTWTQQAKLIAPGVASNDWLGSTVAISGDTIVVGAFGDDVGANSEQGSAYVFTRSGTTWTPQQQLIASDGAASDYFSYSLAISGDTIVVGAFGDDIGVNDAQGSAYVFTRSGTTWTEQQKLTASDGLGDDRLGSSVAIDGDTIVIGAYDDDIGANSAQGSAYVFTRSGTVWTEQAKLTASDGTAADFFGSAAAISGDTIVVGAFEDDVNASSNQGSAYVFTRSGAVWTEQQKLISNDGATNDFFGVSVDMDGNSLVVGARFDDIGANADQGSASVFTRSGTVWTEQTKLTASDGVGSDSFGISVAISGAAIAVGEPADNNSQGAAWVFPVP